MIGCCNSFKDCSDAGECIKLNNPLYEEVYKGCLYKSNLDMGKNFYTDYNENNRIKAEEYQKKQCSRKVKKPSETLPKIKKEVEIVEDIKKEENALEKSFRDKYKRAYLVINERQFYIGTRGSYNGATYALGTEGIERLIQNIGDLPIHIDTEYLDEMYQDENGTFDDRADWTPYFKIGQQQYNLMNSNLLGLKESTCNMIANYFADLGIEVNSECPKNGRNNRVFKPSKPKKSKDKQKPIVDTIKLSEDKKTKKAKVEQLSLF
ncbi:hypothetical protein [Senegalia massiliensis]|uniref:Uncharacterized protein n=1 Tax=Senegalia massiliensis TaxID=1720316 RepID=A0A845R4W1_9CLOT|nr:hypothetical protein [Senegalia massiliensis]NBI07543.1 hypothetical protein [Senegalia massiliensis]